MERLSSCYFCGVAVEAEVKESPAVVGDPAGLDLPPEADRPTVALCASCRNKLDRIVAGLGHGSLDGEGSTVVADDPGTDDGDGEGVVDSAEGSEPGASTAGGDARTPASDSSTAGTDQSPTTTNATGSPPSAAGPAGPDDGDDESAGIDPDAEIFGDTDAVRLGEDSRGDPNAEATGDGPEDGSAASPDPGDRTEDDEGTASDDDGKTASDDDGRTASDDDGGPASEEEPEIDGEDAPRSYTASQAAGGRSTSSHGEGTRDDGRSEGTQDGEGHEKDGRNEESQHGEEGEADGTGAGSADDSGDPSREHREEVPREAYDKVVRLLQNREFPVEEGDILAVATNAYGLNRRDCEAALERLTDQGVIDRDGGRLYRSG